MSTTSSQHASSEIPQAVLTEAGAASMQAIEAAVATAPTRPVADEPEPAPRTPARPRRSLKRLVMWASTVLVTVVAIYFLVPFVRTALTTVSTDDAYVNGHFTIVAPRVGGQVVRVLVDDNNRVRKGDLLVQLDKQPYQIQVDTQQAAVKLAQANLAAAHDNARALVARARSNRFKLENAIEQVDNQIALLRAKTAALETNRAVQLRSREDLDRALRLQKTPGVISQEDIDHRQAEFRVAEAQVMQSLQEVYQVRVGLGLPAKAPEGKSLNEVPEDLAQNFSAVRQALADLLQSAASLGIAPPSYNASPREVIEDFYRRDPNRDLDKIYAQILPNVPEVKQAEAQLSRAESDLADAQLNLSYCDVYAEIDGVVTRRNVNPGNNLQAGQSVMAVRSLTEIWIDANFKETQLGYLRIGQQVEMKVDMYGRTVRFPGRITGFTMGTGSTLALLPAENATGNFIKVVQRLPVRIEPVNYDPDKNPLFIGLSVVPYVYIDEPATGPHAGEYLQPPIRPIASTAKPAPEAQAARTVAP